MGINKDSQKAPILRFKGFTDDWEEHKLENVVEINPSSNLPNSFHYVDLESVKGTELIYSRIEYRDTAPSRAKRLARNGDVFFQLVRPYQKNNYLFNLEGRNYVFSTGYAQMRPSISSEYLINYLTTDKFIFQVLNRSTGSSYPAINSTDLIKIKIAIPQNELESFKIGRILELINQTITLHQRKLDQLNQLKEALLQQMFPGKGETVPKLRFAGFEGEWEELKLSAVVDKQIKGKAQADKLNPGIVEYLDTARLNGGEPFLTDGISNVMKNDILILWDGSKAGTVYIGFEGTLGSTLKAYRTSSDSQFVFQYLKRYQEHIYNNYRTPNIPHVQKDFLEVFNIKVPTMKEQTKIGHTLNYLDETIILQQRKLDQIKNMKQVLLQNMFI